LNDFDAVIVGGGIVGAYAATRLGSHQMRLAVIDKADFEDRSGAAFELAYYGSVDGYRKKSVGGLSLFWGGQIQDVDPEALHLLLGEDGETFTRAQVASARTVVLRFLGLDAANMRRPGDGTARFRRVLNRWLGRRRLFAAEFLRNTGRVTVLRGKVRSITPQAQGSYRIEYEDVSSNMYVVTCGHVVFSAGVMGLAEYLLGLEPTGVLHYRDHYSVSLGMVSARSELGHALRPLFVTGQIVTPRIYFLDSPDDLSLYAAMPLQQELGTLRTRLRDGVLRAITYILFNRKVFQLSAFICGLVVARLAQSQIPVLGGKVKVNAFIDTGWVARLAIRKTGGDVMVDKLLEGDLAVAREQAICMIRGLGFYLEHGAGSEPYVDCGYHAYGLTSEDGRRASRPLTEIGVVVAGASELPKIGDRNPVFLSLVFSELQLKRLLGDE
jgi:hypothetical protein